MKQFSPGAQFRAQGRTKEQKEKETESSDQSERIIGRKRTIGPGDAGRIGNGRTFKGKQILSGDDFCSRDRGADN